jgi:hypothetical protein
MANRYAIPVRMADPYFGGGSGCGGGDGWDDDDGGGGGGCGNCDPGDQSPLPSPFNPWVFCPANYPTYADEVPE